MLNLQLQFSPITNFFFFLLSIPFLATLIFSLFENEIKKLEFYIFLFLLGISAFFIIGLNNLLSIYIFFEISTLTVWRLVSLKKNKESITAGNWTLYINFGAAVLMLIGLAIIYDKIGSFDLVDLGEKGIPFEAGVLILAGIFAKSAILPFYSWLPYAYVSAPIPVIAVLAGVAENLGLIIFFKLFVEKVIMPTNFYYLACGFSLISSIIAGGIAYYENNLRKILAYSTISQMGLSLLGMATLTNYGISGALFLIFTHSLAKPGLFYGLKTLADSYSTLKETRGALNEESGLFKLTFTFLCLALVGLPPFLGFIAKFLIVLGSVKMHYLLGIGAILSAVLTLIYTLRFWSNLYFLGSEVSEKTSKKSSSQPIKIAKGIVFIFALALLVSGIIPFLPQVSKIQYLGGW